MRERSLCCSFGCVILRKIISLFHSLTVHLSLHLFTLLICRSHLWRCDFSCHLFFSFHPPPLRLFVFFTRVLPLTVCIAFVIHLIFFSCFEWSTSASGKSVNVIAVLFCQPLSSCYRFRDATLAFPHFQGCILSLFPMHVLHVWKAEINFNPPPLFCSSCNFTDWESERKHLLHNDYRDATWEEREGFSLFPLWL